MNNQEVITAREMLAGWIKAEKALMTSLEYRMGTKMLRRADLPTVRDAIKYWKNEVALLEGRPRNRVQQVIPRDI